MRPGALSSFFIGYFLLDPNPNPFAELLTAEAAVSEDFSNIGAACPGPLPTEQKRSRSGTIVIIMQGYFPMLSSKELKISGPFWIT